ncbi:hypothetical protein CEXT_139051 [Caerostris extrusa]|uniref:Uncharacterized protein n=1 Tax=Caerostris extrusa TaxID=172846 RepID=A0AAV4W878_CAEEX|nr:hypothetical protein CEXT_139051 [Caerostris extrusa]
MGQSHQSTLRDEELSKVRVQLLDLIQIRLINGQPVESVRQNQMLCCLTMARDTDAVCIFVNIPKCTVPFSLKTAIWYSVLAVTFLLTGDALSSGQVTLQWFSLQHSAPPASKCVHLNVVSVSPKYLVGLEPLVCMPGNVVGGWNKLGKTLIVIKHSPQQRSKEQNFHCFVLKKEARQLTSRNRKFSEQERANLWSPCSSSDENNSPTALNSFNWDKPALEDKSVDFGWTASQDNINGKIGQSKTTGRKKINPCSEKKAGSYVNLQQVDSKYLRECTTLESKQSPTKAHELTQGCGSSSDSLKPERIYPLVDLEEAVEPKAPPASLLEEDESYERTDEEIEREKEELRNVAWFQAGIPREIALEVLAEKPEGSFHRIAHYLILQTNKGYKIKGFTKEFKSLKALITHHSVMPELLPCPLNLSREHTRDASTS